MLENAATRYCTPEVKFSSKEWNIDGKKVLEVSIPRSDEIPHRAPDHNNKQKAYIRVNDQNILASGIQMKIWQKNNTNNVIQFVYSEDAKKFLSMFFDDKPITLSNIIANSNLSRYKTENMLADLVIMKVLVMIVDEFTASFLLNEAVEKEYLY